MIKNKFVIIKCQCLHDKIIFVFWTHLIKLVAAFMNNYQYRFIKYKRKFTPEISEQA